LPPPSTPSSQPNAPTTSPLQAMNPNDPKML
jgi:hypothetical protein